MKKILVLLAAIVMIFSACNDNAPSGEDYVGGVSARMADYVGTWKVEGDNDFLGSPLLYVQLNADTSCYFAVDDKYRGVIVYRGAQNCWKIMVYHDSEDEVELSARGGYKTASAQISYVVLKTEPNKLTLESRGYLSSTTYFVRTTADIMTEYIAAYGEKDGD